MIIYTHQKSKKKNKTKKEIAEHQAWVDSILNQKTNFSKTGKKYSLREVVFDPNKIPKLTCPPGRETVRHPSLNSSGGNGVATKPMHGKVYTGTAMLGIGTLHKSNAVPIFTDEEARDQANMRR
jgi:hypothetical protein